MAQWLCRPAGGKHQIQHLPCTSRGPPCCIPTIVRASWGYDTSQTPDALITDAFLQLSLSSEVHPLSDVAPPISLADSPDIAVPVGSDPDRPADQLSSDNTLTGPTLEP